jgi:hypothetical protein
MTLHRQSLVGAVCCFILFVTGLSAQSLQVMDADGESTTITAAQISTLPRVTANTVEHGARAVFEGAPLTRLLELAGVPMGDTLRDARLTEVLLVKAADGYKGAFALAELDPAFASRQIILADQRDGKQLDSKDGPFSVVAPGDKRPARWIRQVVRLELIAVK